MEQRCPKCHGTICRLGNREKPFLCRTCKAWYSKDEVAVKPSRADKIRDMSDEELAEFFAQQEYKKPTFDGWLPLCYHVMGPRTCHENGCKECWLDWLKQEVKCDG